MKKADAEKILIGYIKEKGLSSHSEMYGEGRNRNKVYYYFYLQNGEQRFWTDPSEKFKTEIGIK